MKVLLVEDSAEKLAHARQTIEQAIAPAPIHIDVAQSFISATRRLEAETYDLLVLDIVLPIRDRESPVLNGGKNVLSEIIHGNSCRRPSHIICLTAFDDKAELLKDEEEKNLVHVILYNETGAKWREALAAKIVYVHERLRDSETRPRDYKIDVAILTSSPLVELNAVKRLPGGFVSEYNQQDALDYYSAGWTRTDGRTISVVACAAPRMGMTSACATACKVIERWRPRFLAMAGIAAGTKKKDTSFGDILVADSCFDYGSGKIEERETGERVFIPSPTPLRMSAEESAILQRWEQEQLRMDEIRRAYEPSEQRCPRLVIGVLATGAAVIQNQNIVDEILSTSRKVVGLDMEAYGVFEAAYLASIPRPRVIVAKSISDFADKRKNDKWQHYAAFTSARFLFEFFTNSVQLDLGRV